MPDFDDPRMMRAMSELERDMEHLDENNPKHMAHMMRKNERHHAAGHRAEGTRVAINGSKPQDPEKDRGDMGTCSGDLWATRRRGGPAATRTIAGFVRLLKPSD